MQHLLKLANRLFPFEIVNIVDWVWPELLRISPIWIDVGYGLKIQIDSRATLATFSEIFFHHIYESALTLTNKLDVVLDIGANKGLFSFYVSWYCRQQGLELPDFWCIEAAKPNLDTLQYQVTINKLDSKFHLIQGIVTNQRNGVAKFRYTPRASGRARIAERGYLTGKRVPIIDMGEKLKNVSKISVIKLDIEGAEEKVIEEYGDVLGKAQSLIIEFHLKEIDHDRCISLLKRYGFELHTRPYQYLDELCVETFVRHEEP